HILFSLHLPPPPSSTLFPYTTLFRSFMPKSTALRHCSQVAHRPAAAAPVNSASTSSTSPSTHRRNRVTALLISSSCCCSADIGRSEEHTSELQSLRHLVCRLLLEKKK